MSRVKNRDTLPERLVRSELHRMGFRFRLQRRDLPGVPDLVLPKYRRAIFVHGCFWHGHHGCSRSKRPSSNVDFWNAKLNANLTRDQRNQRRLRRLGWSSNVIWECETKNPAKLRSRLHQIIENL